ncbi:hypothetical protein DFJ65_0641 [Calidifontibacter indicus]|uniref:EGF-like domain-containing protein n=1 Tax=Calidifontibacter indicus TaxID=419650 RepID=A0A3D9UK29_9MICO|nr:hypothetical protein DFJ65_0641 [Calidifontibacter indicus]
MKSPTSPSGNSTAASGTAASGTSAAAASGGSQSAGSQDSQLVRRDANDTMAVGSITAPVVLVLCTDMRCPLRVWSGDCRPEHEGAGRHTCRCRPAPFGVGCQAGAPSSPSAAAADAPGIRISKVSVTTV